MCYIIGFIYDLVVEHSNASSNLANAIFFSVTVVKKEKFQQKNLGIFSSPEPLGSQGELIGWP